MILELEEDMLVEATAFGTYFREGLELIESKPFQMLEGAELLLHLFDNGELRGRVLRADAVRALVEMGETRWWLERKGTVDRWVVRAREGTQRHGCARDDAKM